MLQDKRVLLRPILKSDLEKLNQWKNNIEIFKYLGGGFNPTSIDEHINWIDSLIKIDDKNKRFIICFEDKAIGMIGLYSINHINQNCEVGMYIGELEFQSMGLGREAYNLIENYAKNYLNLKKIKLNVVLDNQAALKFWENVGFKKIGTFKKERFIDGEFKDLCIMEKFI